MNHRDAMMSHARRRLQERYRLRVTLHELEALNEHLLRMIAGGLPPVATTQQDGAPVYRLRVRGTVTWALWSERQQCIVTFLSGGSRDAARSTSHVAEASA